MVHRSLSIEDQARQAHGLRNTIRRQARDLMADQAERARLDRDYKGKTFEELVNHKIEKYGFSREQAYRDIIATATKTNKEVNKSLGVDK